MSNKTSSRALARKDSSRWARRRNLRKQRGGSGIDITVLLVKRGFSCSKHSVGIREPAPDQVECRSQPHRPRRSATAQPPQCSGGVEGARRRGSGGLPLEWWTEGREEETVELELNFATSPIPSFCPRNIVTRSLQPFIFADISGPFPKRTQELFLTSW